MHYLTSLLTILLCVGCTLTSFPIQQAPNANSKAVVFDIDGTLTPRPMAVFSVREDAASTVQLFSERGYKIIYLSARVALLQRAIPGWLADNGFPEGSIHVPANTEDSGDHAAFKARVLNQYKDRGWLLVAGFGDSATDFEAYAQVGIDASSVFALQRQGEEACLPGVWVTCFSTWSGQRALMETWIRDNQARPALN
ncbi:hypothetical protein QWY82_01610 [Simiduia curdlanivorans]|uniref:LNS2/PITP domain-containing protein n=1 Tax=Simiduia curdlanivorans TaxID=1492769 RepID=A0ABV8V1T7_9GAMM|nr:hypothetical protein [Simiduia curdlanivorans]MDN3637493.1 hypothetical protein [Simiduia curdlanivorans]